jgi:hypothetical protein
VSNQNFCGNGKTSSLKVIVSQISYAELQIQGLGTVYQDKIYSYTLPSTDGIKYTWVTKGGEVQEGHKTSEVSVKWTEEGNATLGVTQKNSCGKAEAIILPLSIHSKPDRQAMLAGLSG